jgi:hypothetical protein
MAITTLATLVSAATLSSAIITQNPVALRSAPHDSAKQQAVLWQGEVVEVRGTRMDYLQVYDYKRERAGYIRADQVRMTRFERSEAAELLSIVRFVHDTPGAETLGIGFAAAYLKAAPAEEINGSHGAEVLEAIGSFADRLARRASSAKALSKTAEATLSAQLDVASQYGIKFKSFEMADHIQICYDGEAYRQVLAMQATPAQLAHAVLSLTDPECIDPNLPTLARSQMDVWRSKVLDHANNADLPGYLKNRIEMRRASIYSQLAYQRSRLQNTPDALQLSGIDNQANVLAQRAIDAFGSVNKNDLPEADLPLYNDTAMQVNANRWAAMPEQAASTDAKQALRIVTSNEQPGETCIALIDAKHGIQAPLAKRCSYGLVWPGSVSVNREQNAIAIAVQPLPSWREMWVFRKTNNSWAVSVLPPAATSPALGYIEFAGWVPGGRQMLVAREARGEGRYKHNCELINLDTLSTERQASDPALLGAFQRWQDPAWKQHSLSVR